MVLKNRARNGWLCLILAQLHGCSGSGTPPVANQNTVTASADRLEKAMQIASLHLKYKEYDEAEQGLQAALSDPAVTGTAEALALLETIKAAKRTDDASATAAGQPQNSTTANRNVTGRSQHPLNRNNRPRGTGRGG